MIKDKREYDREYRRKNKEKISLYKKEWAKNNPDKIKESQIRNKNSKKISDKKYVFNNIEKINLYKKEWAIKNKDKVKAANNKYHKNKILNDPLYKLKHYMSNTIRHALRSSNLNKKIKTIKILGCSYIELRLYIESKFENWMTWENYGNPTDGIFELNKSWDLDHIIPLSSANTEDEVIKLCHYTNIQPLCSYNNRFIKKNKI